MGVAIGIFFLGLGLWVLFSYIPSHDSHRLNSIGSFAHAVATNEKFLTQDGKQRLSLIGWVLTGLGVLQLITGTFKRPKVKA